MIKPETVRELAMAFEEATEEPHFEKTSFRIKKSLNYSKWSLHGKQGRLLTEMERHQRLG